MEYTNHGSSPYHEAVGSWVRAFNGKLTHVTGKNAATIEDIWPTLQQKLAEFKKYKGTVLRTGAMFWSMELPLDTFGETFQEQAAVQPLPENIAHINQNLVLKVQECIRPAWNQTIGMLSICHAATSDDLEFNDWFRMFLLAESRVSPPWFILPDVAQAKKDASGITDMFDKELRNIAPEDKWNSGGRDVFHQGVEYFTARQDPVEFALPAFPCKSTNYHKTNGILPDRAEEMALVRLHDFCHKVKQIYSPGAILWIISDGHVFSDCIGVDDEIVNEYGRHLHEMNHRIAERIDGPNPVGFLSLEDFFHRNEELTEIFTTHNMEETQTSNHLDTVVTETARTCRRVMMAGCQIRSETLRARIDNADTATLRLYRGFSRFMQDDIAEHASAVQLSKKQRKDKAFKIAFEMIRRNQAYSNLVEMLFPHHVRLSIHAHDNSGPKFGVRMLSSADVRPIESLDACLAPQTSDHLHIPTPWHNCLVEVEGHDLLYITKSKVAREAIRSGEYEGSWIAIKPEGGGGYFALRKLLRPNMDAEALDRNNHEVDTGKIDTSYCESGEKTRKRYPMKLPEIDTTEVFSDSAIGSSPEGSENEKAQSGYVEPPKAVAITS